MAAVESTPVLYERDIRSATRPSKRAKDNKIKWRFGNRHAAGVRYVGLVDGKNTYAGGNLQHLTIRRPECKHSDDCHCNLYDRPKGRNFTKIEARAKHSVNTRRAKVLDHVQEELVNGRRGNGSLNRSECSQHSLNNTLLQSLTLASPTAPNTAQASADEPARQESGVSILQDNTQQQADTETKNSQDANATLKADESVSQTATGWLSSPFGVGGGPPADKDIEHSAAEPTQEPVAEQEDSNTKEEEEPSADQPVSSEAYDDQGDHFLYSFDSTDSPGLNGRTVSLNDFVRNPSQRETERLVAREWEVLDGKGDSLKGQQARKALRRKKAASATESSDKGTADAKGKMTDNARNNKNSKGGQDDEGFELV